MPRSRCAHCLGPLEVGRLGRRFCSPACRQAAARRREAGLPEAAPTVTPRGRLPLRRLLEEPPARPEDQDHD